MTPAERTKLWRQTHPDYLKRHRGCKDRYYKEHQTEIMAAARKRYKDDPEYRKQTQDRNRNYKRSQRGKDTDRARKRRNKELAFAAYGGYKCSHCGITDPDILTIDHIGGKYALAHKKEGKLFRGDQLYNWLKSHDYPSTFQVLCFNCNIKAFLLDKRNNPQLYRHWRTRA